METTNKKTAYNSNIKCEGCIAKVTPHLNELIGEDQWQVDIGSPSKTLTVEGDVSEADINKALQKAGYWAKKA
ncbi:MAG: heavy-metal-associated domain-containing protein [Bacteroidia bacterium]|nr:heavy-metal-associated domain-containing protein [Bacteroidia bacterium]